MNKCRFPDNEGKESKRLSKFDIFFGLSEDEDVLNLREPFGVRATVTSHLLLIKGKIPLGYPAPCNIIVSTPRLILWTKKTPFM
jgi:hypothetical protein